MTGENAEPLPEGLTEALDRLEFAGNNGWGDAPGKRDAKRILGEMRSVGSLDVALITSALAARGVSAHALKQLRSLAKS